MEMLRGAVCLVDALGFKGLWQQYRTHTILAKLHEMRNATLRLAEHADAHVRHGRTHVVRFLSDTVVIACHSGRAVDLSEADLDFDAVQTTAILANTLMRVALNAEPILLYRGAIAVGTFTLDGNFLIGEAVDESAEAMDKADGAFIWTTPGACMQIERRGHVDSETMFVKYPVPLKCGHTHAAAVVNPFRFVPDSDRSSHYERMIQSFSRSTSDVNTKKHNTAMFLTHALAVTPSLTGQELSGHVHLERLPSPKPYEWDK